MAKNTAVEAAIEELGNLVAAAGGEGDGALDVVKDELAARGAPRNDTLDVDALNAQAAALYEVAWHRGYHAGEDRKTSEVVEHYGKDSRKLAVQMLDSALSATADDDATADADGATNEWARWALARYARLMLGQTPGSAAPSYTRPLALLSTSVSSDGKTDVGGLLAARNALAAVDGGEER